MDPSKTPKEIKFHRWSDRKPPKEIVENSPTAIQLFDNNRFRKFWIPLLEVLKTYTGNDYSLPNLIEAIELGVGEDQIIGLQAELFRYELVKPSKKEYGSNPGCYIPQEIVKIVREYQPIPLDQKVKYAAFDLSRIK